jgi:outer membrane lipoprotein carrier protein
VCVLFTLAPLWAADPDISKLLKQIEDHYNGARSLEAAFRESYAAQGRRRTESGRLYLRKPGRMRWEYTTPAGKLFISDGKNVYFYSPDTNRAEKMKLKETEDMRAPLAFLLGRLDFRKDFKEFRAKPETGGTIWITALPRSDKLPYREVSFLVDETNSRISRLVVTGQDASVLEFEFSGEKLNAPVADAQFRFEVPKGAEFVDETASPETAQ